MTPKWCNFHLMKHSKREYQKKRFFFFFNESDYSLMQLINAWEALEKSIVVFHFKVGFIITERLNEFNPHGDLNGYIFISQSIPPFMVQHPHQFSLHSSPPISFWGLTASRVVACALPPRSWPMQALAYIAVHWGVTPPLKAPSIESSDH